MKGSGFSKSLFYLKDEDLYAVPLIQIEKEKPSTQISQKKIKILNFKIWENDRDFQKGETNSSANTKQRGQIGECAHQKRENHRNLQPFFILFKKTLRPTVRYYFLFLSLHLRLSPPLPLPQAAL